MNLLGISLFYLYANYLLIIVSIILHDAAFQALIIRALSTDSNFNEILKNNYGRENNFCTNYRSLKAKR